MSHVKIQEPLNNFGHQGISVEGTPYTL
jgi:hypothetical protein